jgi:hypothetical protein
VPELVQHDQRHDPEDGQKPAHGPSLAGRRAGGLPSFRRSGTTSRMGQLAGGYKEGNAQEVLLGCGWDWA